MIEQDRRNVHRVATRNSAARHVCILAGSLGGPAGMKRFFTHLPAQLPVAFLVAQHISSDALPLLCHFFARATSRRVLPGLSGHHLKHGEVIVLPMDRRLDFTEDGQLKLDVPPVPEVFPIDQVMTAVARYYGRQAGAIVFSGIGEDGQHGCQALIDCGAEIWTQSEASCRFSSMPRYVANTCQPAFTATPEALAARLVEELTIPRRNKAV